MESYEVSLHSPAHRNLGLSSDSPAHTLFRCTALCYATRLSVRERQGLNTTPKYPTGTHNRCTFGQTHNYKLSS
ncbi:hypothetical protein CEXT_703111 [Caerostris extrusa]|uniref:Uncharacterized protein n=1 Tax=Caerostris extrusa TaxID=172846 RepID=A0AAV4XVA7_CAEEX|nr:hypothetical protein CEXT_703111 [Caerostris extrusa]